ncbi:MAG: hypothetical protein AAF713_13980 [Pseudomonadota bacterium]
MLGHHRDAAPKTLLLNLFHSGPLAATPPKPVNGDVELFVLRLLALVGEVDCGPGAEATEFPIIAGDLCSERDWP